VKNAALFVALVDGSQSFGKDSLSVCIGVHHMATCVASRNEVGSQPFLAATIAQIIGC
jgi:hypothetical protein